MCYIKGNHLPNVVTILSTYFFVFVTRSRLENCCAYWMKPVGKNELCHVSRNCGKYIPLACSVFSICRELSCEQTFQPDQSSKDNHINSTAHLHAELPGQRPHKDNTNWTCTANSRWNSHTVHRTRDTYHRLSEDNNSYCPWLVSPYHQ